MYKFYFLGIQIIKCGQFSYLVLAVNSKFQV
jgi:hypothetical protein